MGTGHILLTHGANKRPQDLSLASKGVVTQSRREAQLRMRHMTGKTRIGCEVMLRSWFCDALPRKEMRVGVACVVRRRAAEREVLEGRRQFHVGGGRSTWRSGWR